MEGDFDGGEWSDRPRGRKPEDVLTPKQYLDYRHGRLLSGLLVFFGCVFALVGIAQLADPPTKDGEPPALWAGAIALGLMGAVGGAAAFQGNREWGRLAYPFVALLVFGIPIGTIISILWLSGRERHLAAAERVRRAQAGDAESYPNSAG